MSKQFIRKIRAILVFALIMGGTWAFSRWASSEETIIINGKVVSVIDGDSFKDADTEYRLYGIDAPEYRQTCKDTGNRDWPCGKSARIALEGALKEGQYSCNVYARDQYGRTIVTCVSGDKDVGAHMVEQGHAMSSDNFDQVIYGAEEARAEKAKRGIWQGAFEKPSNWRAAHPR